MSHNINENRVMLARTPAWHGLGTVVETEQTAENAIKLAGLDYTVKMVDMFQGESLSGLLKVNDYQAIIREDNRNLLGIATKKYKIVQNIEAFNFFDIVVGEGQAIYHTAGALGQGERIWILAKLPKNIIVSKDDVVETYLCLTTSHDGKSSVRMYHTPVRVVCQNTLNMSMSDAKKGISIRHTGEIKDKVTEARKILGISIDYYNQFEEIIKTMENTSLNVESTKNYFSNVLNVADKDDISTRKENQLDELFQLFENGEGQKLGNKCSLWKAYNAVTEYVDHFSTVKNLEQDKTNKLKNVWFGTGANIKEKAYDEALALIS